MKSVIETFYKAFDQLDAETMTSCYHKDVTFEDPAFGKLTGDRAKNMWRMLCKSQKGKDFEIQYSDIKFENNIGSAHWEAHYNFSKTGRPVHNKIDSSFEFKDGKIIKHTDKFNLHQWAKQAMGFRGSVLGKTLFFKNKLQNQTRALLSKFELQLKLDEDSAEVKIKMIGSRYVLAVKDLELSANYYKTQLGFITVWSGGGWHFLKRESFFVMLGECPDDRSAFETKNHSYFAYIDVEHIDVLYNELKEKDIEIISEIADKDWQQREFAIRTIDGHRIMFGQAL